MLKQFKNWLIHRLGGYTPNEYKSAELLIARRDRQLEISKIAADFWYGRAAAILAEKEAILGNLKTCEAEIPLGGAMRYTENNVITESRNQTYYLLGKAVYPYAKHFVTTNKYICTINVQGKEE